MLINPRIELVLSYANEMKSPTANAIFEEKIFLRESIIYKSILSSYTLFSYMIRENIGEISLTTDIVICNFSKINLRT